MPALTETGLPDCPQPRSSPQTLEVPEGLRQTIAQLSPAALPVIHVRYVPRMNAWLTLSAESPRVPANPASRASATSPKTSQSTLPAQATSPAQPAQSPVIFDRLHIRSFPVTTTNSGVALSSVPRGTLQLLQNVFDHPEGVFLADYQLDQLKTVATLVRVVPSGARGAIGADSNRRLLTYQSLGRGPRDHIWYIRWHLSRASQKGGWIVQHVDADFPRAHVHFDYWEAWRVKPGASVTTLHRRFWYDDEFDTAGEHGTVHASAAFYEGLTLPPEFRVANPKTAAHLLRSTTNDPKLPTTDATDPVARDWRP